MMSVGPESELEFGKLQQGEIRVALHMYANKEGLVSTAATMDRIRKQMHIPGMHKGWFVSTQIKADHLAAKSKQLRNGTNKDPEIVIAKLQKKMVEALKAQNQALELGAEVQRGIVTPTSSLLSCHLHACCRLAFGCSCMSR